MRRPAHRSFPWFVLTRLVALIALAPACAAALDPGAAEDAPPTIDGKADGQTVVDPCRSYPDRIRLLRLLEEAHPYPFAGSASAWEDGREGFITQTQWQLDSGRAARSTSGDTLWGWWPNVNYTLTTWQLLVLQQRGDLPGVYAVEYLDGDRFDPSPAAARALEAYYDELDATRRLAEAGQLSAAEVPARQARLQQLLWTFHATALADGLARNADELDRLPWAERRFSRAWGYSVTEILAAINFPTDRSRIEQLNQLLLPWRVVTGSDLNPLASSDLPATQRAGLIALVLLDEFEARTDKLVLRTVRAFVTSADRAVIAAEAFVALLNDHDIEAFLGALSN